MFNRKIDRRKLIAMATVSLLAACQTGPRRPSTPPPPPPPPPPNANVLPADQMRHRVALLVPMTGPNAAVGQSIANATTKALLDMNASNLRITTYDTALGATVAASRAVADGNKLILGPLLSEDIPAVIATARNAHVPVISYSNDASRAGRDVFIMGMLPSASVERTVAYARSQGLSRFAGLAPVGEYGQRASAALAASVRAQRGTLVAMESYDRSGASVTSAARRLKAKGGYEAVLIADGGRLSALAAPQIKAPGDATRVLGTELWSGDAAVVASPALRGAWFSAVSDGRYRQFAESYRARFGAPPYRISTLGYDSVLLTLRIAREWRPGSTFPTARMFDRGGFVGVDGAFRFSGAGVIERALEVRQVRAGGVDVVSEAPAQFGGD